MLRYGTICGVDLTQARCDTSSSPLIYVHVMYKTNLSDVVNPFHAGPVYICGKYKTSVWSQMPRRQVGAELSVAIMV